MKSFFAVLLLTSFSAHADPRGVVDAEIKDVREFTTEHCDCHNPEYIGKICIASTRWSQPLGPVPMSQDPMPLTNFEAHVVNDVFQIISTAYYMRCTFGPTPIVFTDPDLQRQFEGKKFFDFEGVKGLDPWMKIAFMNGDGTTAPYFDAVKGDPFRDEPFYSNKGESLEHYRMEYPGRVTFSRPLNRILTDFTIRRILDGEDVIKTMKAVLMNQIASDRFVGFGEYTLKVRFFKKPGSVPNGMWDTSVIGIQVVN